MSRCDVLAMVPQLSWIEQQPSKLWVVGSNPAGITDVKTDKNDWYILSAVDIGWEFTKRLKVSNENGKIVISDICPVED